MYGNYAILLNKSIPFDLNKVKLLDQVVSGLYSNDIQQINVSNKILTELKADPDFWLVSNTILENSQNNNTKFLAYLALEDVVKTRWNILKPQQKENIKNYIISMVIKMGPQLHDKTTNHLLHKANEILVGIVKHEWNTTWNTFIPEICGSSKSDQTLCENNLNILKMLSEEIFDYSKNSMMSNQIQQLRTTMTNEFTAIYELCYFVMKSYVDNPQLVKTSLVGACLNTLYSFLSWIPLGYIFLTDMINMIMILLETKEHKILALKCLIEIGSLQLSDLNEQEESQIKIKLIGMYTSFIAKIHNTIPLDIPLSLERQKLEKIKSTHLVLFDNVTQQIALFLTSFFNTHLNWIESYIKSQSGTSQPTMIDCLKKGFQGLVYLSELPDQIYKICVEFWFEFTNNLTNKGKPDTKTSSKESSSMNIQESNVDLKNEVYNPILKQVCRIVISKMARPEEVRIVISDHNIPVREYLENTENTSLYDIMKDLLINLTKLDWENMKSIIIDKLEKQLDGSEWSFDNLNSLCWAIGAISGVLDPDDERLIMIMIIRILLHLSENKKGKENKAVVATNIMHIVGRYPRFLKSNWNFYKTVIKKLFEFMHETYEGIMDMACNTFLTVAKASKEQFVILHDKPEDFHNCKYLDSEPYINEIIKNIPEESISLEPMNKLIFYEAIGHIISAEADIDKKQSYLESILKEYWESWRTITIEALNHFDMLKNEKVLEQLTFIIKVHERLAFTIGNDFSPSLGKLYLEMIKIYMIYAEIALNDIRINGKHMLNMPIIKKMRAIKREILRLIQTFLESINTQNNQSVMLIVQNFIPPLADILQNYVNSTPELREAEVISLFSIIIPKLSGFITEFVPKILEYIINGTLGMITLDFNSYPEHRINFFDFLKAVVSNCFVALFNIPPAQFKTIIDCVVWAFKHDLANIYEMGLDTLIIILKNVNLDIKIANQFYQQYYIQLLQDILFVLTDSLHKNGFKQQTIILAMMFDVLDKLNVPIYKQVQYPYSSNQDFIYQYTVDLLSSSFPNISKQKTALHVQELFKTCKDIHQFKIALRDYLINLTQFQNDHNVFEVSKTIEEQFSKQQKQKKLI